MKKRSSKYTHDLILIVAMIAMVVIAVGYAATIEPEFPNQYKEHCQ